MESGTRLILEGAVEGVPHRVEFTVTDLTKVVDDVRTLVIWRRQCRSRHSHASQRGVSSRYYVQGFAPEIDFLDCARIAQREQQTCVPAGCFNHVLVTHETNLLDPEGGIQSKFHAPRVGIVRVGSVDPPTGETLELVAVEELSPSALREVRREALRLDRHGYRLSKVYRSTEPAKQLRD
jgi:hypothetical protein